MIITKERTRLIFTEFTAAEKKYLEEIVSSMDNVFIYIDPDGDMLGLPTGMEKSVKKLFPNAKFIDNSNEYWPYATTQKVEHSAKPRNQLQKDFINFVIENAKKKQKVVGILSTGVGKPIVNSARIPTPNGYQLMGMLKQGDEVFGSNGEKCTVTAVYPQGNIDIYDMKFSDGRVVKCGLDHLWLVYSGNEVATMTTREIMDSDKDWEVPVISGPIMYDKHEVEIDPYVVGAYIGSGIKWGVKFSLIPYSDYVPAKVAKIIGATFKKDGHKYTFVKNKADIKTAGFFRNLPVVQHGGSIPSSYICNDVETRMNILRGILDSSAVFKFTRGGIEIRLEDIDRTLSSQIRYILHSLGCSTTSLFNKNGVEHAMILQIPNRVKHAFFTDPKKVFLLKLFARFKDKHKYDTLTIDSIEYAGKDYATCITVDTDDHLFVANDFVLTHNTFMACYSAIDVGLRTLIITPTSSIKQQWADTLIGMFNVPKERVSVINKPSDFVNVKADFVVVSHASLASLNKNYNLEKIMHDNKFGIKVIDEVQMFFKSIINIDSNSNIANNWYLTGTFGRSGDLENKIYQEMFGDIAVFREKEKSPTLFDRKPGNVYGMKPYTYANMIWTHSGISREEINSVMTSIRYSEREGKWMRFGISVPAYMNIIVPPDKKMTKFLKKILQVVKEADKKCPDGKMLVLGPTVVSTETVAYYIKQMMPDKVVNIYNASVPVNEREKMKVDSDILVATVASAGTGFDMKKLRKCVLFMPIRSWILTTQIFGRLRRNKDANGNDIECYFYDIVDSDIGQLRAWANARADVYRRISKKFTVIDM